MLWASLNFIGLASVEKMAGNIFCDEREEHEYEKIQWKFKAFKLGSRLLRTLSMHGKYQCLAQLSLSWAMVFFWRLAMELQRTFSIRGNWPETTRVIPKYAVLLYFIIFYVYGLNLHVAKNNVVIIMAKRLFLASFDLFCHVWNNGTEICLSSA